MKEGGHVWPLGPVGRACIFYSTVVCSVKAVSVVTIKTESLGLRVKNLLNALDLNAYWVSFCLSGILTWGK